MRHGATVIADAGARTPDASALPVAASDASIAIDAAPDALVPDAAPPVDAGPSDAPAPIDAGKVVVAPKRVGHLHVEGVPVLTVYVDKRQVGYTALDVDLPVGKHVVRLSNPDKETFYDRTVTIEIVEGKTVRLER
jgi:hypothetical protein